MIKKYLPWIIALLYFVNPYDLLPDFVLGPGWLDDLAVAALMWWWASRIKRGYHGYGGSGPRESVRYRASTENHEDEQDPYQILGIERGASKDDIKAAYKRLAARYHPDRVQHLGKEFQQLAHKMFVDIQRAYDMLTK